MLSSLQIGTAAHHPASSARNVPPAEQEVYIAIENKFEVPKGVKLLEVSVDDVSRLRTYDTYFVISPSTPGTVQIRVKTSKGNKNFICRKLVLPGDVARAKTLTDTTYKITGPFSED